MLPVLALFTLLIFIGHKGPVFHVLMGAAATTLLVLILLLLRLPTIPRSSASFRTFAVHIIFATAIGATVAWMILNHLSESAVFTTIILVESWICIAIAERKFGPVL